LTFTIVGGKERFPLYSAFGYGAKTFCRTALGITAISITTLSLTPFSLKTLSIITLNNKSHGK